MSLLITDRLVVKPCKTAALAGDSDSNLRLKVAKTVTARLVKIAAKSMLMNGTDSASDGKWQTVKARHTDRPQDSTKKSKAPELTPSTAGRVSATDSAFSALDVWYDQNKQRQHQKPSVDSEEEASRSADSDDEQSSSTEAARSKTQDEPKKAKKPKVRRPKVKPAQAASSLEVSKYKDLLASVQQMYPDNQLSQLQTIADQLLGNFQTSELPFNKLLSEQAVDKVTDVPLQDLPIEVKSLLEMYATQLNVHVVAQFVQSLIDAVLEAVPDASSRQPVPKAKVGLLIFLSLLLRSQPAALLLQCQHLLAGGKKYSGPGRLHLLVWLINQTARCNAAMAVGIWVRVLLPQILGTQLPSILQKTATSADSTVIVLSNQNTKIALEYLDSLLSSTQESPLEIRKNDHGFPEWHAGSVNLQASNSQLHNLASIGLKYVDAADKSTVDPVVPPAAMEGIARTQFSNSSHLQTAQRIKLLKQYEVLRELAFVGAANGGFSCEESLRLSLDTAVLSDGPFQGAGDETVDQAARNMLCCIACDPQAPAVWESRHNKQLKGSTRVLQHLLAVHPQHFRPILASRESKAAFVKLLQSLRQRHRSQLTQGKGSLKTCAKESDLACSGLHQKLASKRNAFGTWLMLLVTLALAAAAIMRNKEGREAWQAFAQTGVGEAVVNTAHSVYVNPFVQQRMLPVWNAVGQQAAAVSQWVADLLSQCVGHVTGSVKSKSSDPHFS